MCEISTIADDWIVKGLHMHVEKVEIAVRPDHKGGITYRRVFAATSEDEFGRAIAAIDLHLQDRKNRARLYRDVQRARDYVIQNTTALRELAVGRAAEFAFLMGALRKMGI
jgi:hypothetical protein